MAQKSGLNITTMSKSSIAPLIKENYPQYYSWHEYPVDNCVAIRKTSEPWGILGNFAATPLEVGGMRFNNSEQLFQMLKFTDEETLRTIYQAKGLPLKWAAKKAEGTGLRRADWGKIIIDVMKFCLQTKYDQSEPFRRALAETADKIIVEDQTNLKTTKSGKLKDADTWGVVLKDGKYIGSNLLGRLLMELRTHGKLNYTLPTNALHSIEKLR